MSEGVHAQLQDNISRSIERSSFEEQMRKSRLYTWGLIDDEFLSQRMSASAREYLLGVAADFQNAPENIPLLVGKAVLTKEDFQKKIFEKWLFDYRTLKSLLMPKEAHASVMPLLIDAQILTRATLWSKFLNQENFYNKAYRQQAFNWKHLISSGILKISEIDSPSDGFDAVEIEALQADLLGESRKAETYPLDLRAHPLVQKLRGQEHTQKMSQQIEKAIGKESASALEDLDRVFEYYLEKLSIYRRILSRERKRKPEVAERERRQNIALVNQHQVNTLKKKNPGWSPNPKFYDPEKRHFDIYARYGHGQMDPLQLAFISKAAEWYIMGGHSRLFNSVRVVPGRGGVFTKKLSPLIALAACKGSTFLGVIGSDFEESMVGANRTFLTHSASREAMHQGSIPIIGLASYVNFMKRPFWGKNFVLLPAYFDMKDPARSRTHFKSPLIQDVAGNIPGLIEASLRAIMEVEDKEIERARG
ncbi:MAG: hypothetical protein KGI73_03790 [Patescibacteria group bacterium]|nr:hypothetical protein [Patescibacteria group bacterium]